MNYSIDLETLGTRYDSYILSIGVAAFDIATGKIVDTFHERVICDDNYHIDVGTCMWWLDQNDDARKSITDRNDAIPIIIALRRLGMFMNSYEEIIVWGNGSHFDITLLDHAYHKSGSIQPWQFWNVRDMRTILSVASELGFDKKLVKREGIHHNAVDDAVYQAKVMIAAHKYIMSLTEGG